MRSKKMMILGAGPFQLEGILEAVEMGLEVITVDNIPGNPGHRISHESVNVSTTDIEGVLRAARENSIDGITTFASDVATPTVAEVCSKLGLPGISKEAVAIFCEKTAFRAFQRQQQLPAPGFLRFEKGDRLDLDFTDLVPPLMVKPVDTSGSRGVTKLSTISSEALERAIQEALGYSRSGRVCIEEFLEGKEVGGDAFLAEGEIVFHTITQKFLRGFNVTGHRLPTDISLADQQQVIDAVLKTCQKIGYHDGPLNFDVMLTPSGPRVIEMSPRTGGNGIPALFRFATGFNSFQATISYALGQAVSLSSFCSPEEIRGCGSIVLGSSIGGVIKQISSVRELQEKVPSIFECQLVKRPGDEVRAFTHGGEAIGFACFECQSEEAYNAITTEISRALNLTLV